MNTAKLNSRLMPYAFALIATGAGFLLRTAVTHFVGSGLPTYVTFYPFIMVMAVLGGLGPGLVTTVTSALIVDYWFVSPQMVLAFQNSADAAGMALFVIMGVLMSVTAESYRRRQAEQAKALRLANIYNRSLIEASLDPLVTISREGKITDVNEATGVAKEKLVGTDFSGYFTEPEKAREGYQQVFAKGFVSDYPLTLRHKDGKLIDVLYNATVYKDIRGTVLGVFAAARDITEFNNLQNRLLRSEKLAIVGKLASSVAHELRNPLGVIKNATYYLDMLELAKNSPELKENMDIINQEIDNSDRIITDLLEFSRAKGPVLRPENINLIVKEILDRLRIAPNIEVALELRDDLPEIEVDAPQMHQTFYNIIKNALEAMEKGGKLKIKTGLKDDGFLEVSFSDTGSGVSKENIAKIFEPLFSTKTKGTGLGLSVCSSIVEGHHGKIEVTSEVGQGTTFTVKLPVNFLSTGS